MFYNSFYKDGYWMLTTPEGQSVAVIRQVVEGIEHYTNVDANLSTFSIN